MSSAAVVGSGPNGLAAALVLAEAGVKVTVYEAGDTPGGGMRSAELIEPGIVHDVCSAVHPLAVASPFFAGAGLAEFGLEFACPEVDLAHPLDDGRAGVLLRDIDATAAGLGQDGPMWKRTFGPFARRFDDLLEETMGPPLHVPRHPLLFAAFGAQAALPATVSWRRWSGDEAPALFAGVAAHALTRLDTPMSSSVGMLLTTAAHARGWPVAIGGSGAIAAAMVAKLESLGGRVETGRRIDSLKEIAGPGKADLVMLNLAPGAAVDVLGPDASSSTSRAYRRFRHGTAAYKVDYVIRGEVPWTNPDARRAGTVHLGGTAAEVAIAEKDCARGRMPERPMVLVGQQHLADTSRSKGDLHPLWAYAHVPSGFPGDLTESVTRQIERFAPGFRDTIVGSVSMSPAQLEDYNPNYVGGDIIGGQSTMVQILRRPTLTSPYETGTKGVYLCSGSTPPGAGVHGMAGANAAEEALAALRR